MPQANQETPATVLQPTDVIYGDQDTGAVDQTGSKIFQTKAFPGSLFGAGNGAVALPPGSLLANPLGSGTGNFGQAILLDQSMFSIDAGGTLRITPSLADNLIAAGATQADALQLTAYINIVTSVVPDAGVRLWSMPFGQVIEVWNFGVNPLAVYPLAGGTINAYSPNAAVAIAPGSNLRFRARSVTAGASLILAG